MTKPPTQQFTITLRAETSHPGPVVNRLRSALKVLLRSFGLRCVAVVEKHEASDETNGNS